MLILYNNIIYICTLFESTHMYTYIYIYIYIYICISCAPCGPAEVRCPPGRRCPASWPRWESLYKSGTSYKAVFHHQYQYHIIIISIILSISTIFVYHQYHRISVSVSVSVSSYCRQYRIKQALPGRGSKCVCVCEWVSECVCSWSPEGGLLVFKLSPYKISKSPSQPGGGPLPLPLGFAGL